MNSAKCLLCYISIYCTERNCGQQDLVCQLAAKSALPSNLYTTKDLRERVRAGWVKRNDSPNGLKCKDV